MIQARALRGRVQDRAVDLGFAAGWRAVRALPQRPVLGIAGRLADRAARRDGDGIQQLRHNLRRVVGPLMPQHELDELVRAGARSYARYWVETFRLPSMPASTVTPRVEVTGYENIKAAHDAGKGVILVLPHMGNWDVAGMWLLSMGLPFTTVAERLKPDSLFRRFVEFREELGFEVLALTGGPPTAPILAQRLEAGGVVCLVGDRAFGSSGVQVDLFGEPALLPPGPAMLAARTGAALLAVGIWFTDRGWGIDVTAPIEAPAGGLAQRTRDLTAGVARAFEQQIAAHPEDWHMLQPIWMTDRAAARARRLAPAAEAG
ncbi:MAG: Phosphatidylinositol mannoside acyltransferase [Jatrophihabitantaceae bacterium]|nr:Phosphatidylinositol mannoside acyltransferase [Jatrophihabitantaceae bacterium]